MPREPPVINADFPVREIMSCPTIPILSLIERLSANAAAHRGIQQSAKQILGKCISDHAFRMPLHANDPVGIAVPFHCFDNSVRRASGNAQILSGFADCLMMRAVDLGFRRASCRTGFASCRDFYTMKRLRSSLLFPFP